MQIVSLIAICNCGDMGHFGVDLLYEVIVQIMFLNGPSLSILQLIATCNCSDMGYLGGNLFHKKFLFKFHIQITRLDQFHSSSIHVTVVVAC